MTVQRPLASRIVSTATNSQLSSGQDPCSSGEAGWLRVVTKIVTDQTGVDIVAGGQNLSETVTITTPNQLNITSVASASAVTNAAGQFQDTFFVCSALCPSSSGETDAGQSITDVFNQQTFILNPNTIVYKCTGITINGQ